jgi:asparagine synthase (glutamine-hydrolysing)
VWLRGPLREWAEALLEEGKLRDEGYFNPEPIRRMWAAHLNGSLNEQYRLWSILMFQSWLEAQVEGHGASAAQVALAS